MRPPNMLKPWGEAEEQLLRTQWPTGSTPLIARQLGRSQEAVAARAHRLGLVRQR